MWPHKPTRAVLYSCTCCPADGGYKTVTSSHTADHGTQVVTAKERESKRVLAVQRALNAVKAANEEVRNMLQTEISVIVQA